MFLSLISLINSCAAGKALEDGSICLMYSSAYSAPCRLGVEAHEVLAAKSNDSPCLSKCFFINGIANSEDS